MCQKECQKECQAAPAEFLEKKMNGGVAQGGAQATKKPAEEKGVPDQERQEVTKQALTSLDEQQRLHCKTTEDMNNATNIGVWDSTQGLTVIENAAQDQVDVGRSDNLRSTRLDGFTRMEARRSQARMRW